MTRLVVVVLLAGCADRAHLAHDTGVAVHAALAAQAGPRGGGALVLSPLDVEILLQNYRSASARGGSNAAEPPRASEPMPSPPAAKEER